MIKFVDENGTGYTEEEVVARRFDELENGADKLTEFKTIEEAISNGVSVKVWSEDDGDGNLLSLEAHYAGFLISLNGDNYLSEEGKKQDQAYVATWLGFEMLGEIKEAMEKYAFLVEGKGHFAEPETQEAHEVEDIE